MEENRNVNVDGCLGWDDVIEKDDQQYPKLEGEYNFTVTAFERGRFPGSAKLPPCNKATLTLSVPSDQGTATVYTDLIMHTSLEWKISGFFRSLGMKKHGERLKMDWGAVVGKQGRAKFYQRPYKTQSGEERTANDIDKFIDYDEGNFVVQAGFTEMPQNASLPF